MTNDTIANFGRLQGAELWSREVGRGAVVSGELVAYMIKRNREYPELKGINLQAPLVAPTLP